MSSNIENTDKEAYREYADRPASGHPDGFEPEKCALEHAFFAGIQHARAELKTQNESLKAQLVERESLYRNAMAGRIRATELLEVATAEVAELRGQLEYADENVVALEKQNKALMQKYEPMRKDAERYRFIRDADRSCGLLDMDDVALFVTTGLDRIVDEAMAKESDQ